ncbi:MAG TPA: peptidoglycan DD-metalloendopeptidase family protein [Burkholderiales bacterium]|nr:peptidoglycan DD-metalloendopeptidase family protein [Burkholderiales bacterium]
MTRARRAGLALVLFPALALAQGEAEKLDQLRSRIEGLRAKIAESEESRTEVRDQLRDSERAISEANRTLRVLASRRAAADEELKSLAKRSRALEAEIGSRRETLGRLLTLRYVNGDQSGVKLLFSGEEPGRIARELHYYGYVSRAQTEFIAELRFKLARLKELEAGTRGRNAEIASIEAAHRAERAALIREQAEHRKVLGRISNQLREQRRQVKHLERDESRLSRLVEELRKLLAAAPKRLRNDRVPEPGGADSSFAGLKPGLRLPIRGELANRFGAQRSDGGPTWKGLFIRSPAGQEVRAVAPGRVVFADWLRGFGNLLIIDHGKSYLTIYGNNESVLKQVGDIVRTGDAVATVGASGGNMESGLYFEIRHEGKAFDPMRWVSLK